jgi:hypothetical protein
VEPSEQADDTQRPILQQNTVNLPKYRICIDSVDKIVEGTMLTTSYIAYRIRFTRMSDLQSHATWKRYKELSTWFQQVLIYIYFGVYMHFLTQSIRPDSTLQLQQKHPELASGQIKFPAASDTWMGNQNDPLGEFVMKRKLDLEVWMQCVPSSAPHMHCKPFSFRSLFCSDFSQESICRVRSARSAPKRHGVLRGMSLSATTTRTASVSSPVITCCS